MFCLPSKDKVRCAHCGNEDIHWEHTNITHDCYSYADHYCKHHRVHWRCKWEECSYDIEYCSSLPSGIIVYTVYGSSWNEISNCEHSCSSHDDPVIKTIGIVKSFSKENVTGYVKVEDQLYSFHSTCFVCSRTPRYPIAGEEVEVMIKKVNDEDIVIAMSSNL